MALGKKDLRKWQKTFKTEDILLPDQYVVKKVVRVVNKGKLFSDFFSTTATKFFLLQPLTVGFSNLQ